MQSRSFHILLSLLQFIPRRAIKKIAVPDQKLSDGLRGTFEIIFENVGDIDQREHLLRSFEIRKQQQDSREQGVAKEIVYVSQNMIDDLKFYLFSDTTTGMLDKSIVKQQEYRDDLLNLFSKMPQFIDMGEALREYVRVKDYDERILAKQPSPGMAPQGPGGAPQPGGGGIPPGATGPEAAPTPGDETANAMSQAVTGQPMPALPATV
jgi:hypothetical protein